MSLGISRSVLLSVCSFGFMSMYISLLVCNGAENKKRHRTGVLLPFANRLSPICLCGAAFYRRPAYKMRNQFAYESKTMPIIQSTPVNLKHERDTLYSAYG